MERRGREAGDHGVVGVRVYCAIAPEGEHDVGFPSADTLDQHGRSGGEIGKLELPILVVENLAMVDVEDFARGDELVAPELAKVFVRFGSDPVGGGLAVGKADDRGLDARLMGEHQSAAKAEAFVVGVGGNAEKFERGFIRHGSFKGNSRRGMHHGS